MRKRPDLAPSRHLVQCFHWLQLRGTTEVHYFAWLLHLSIPAFRAIPSVDADETTSPFEADGLPRGAFLRLEKGTGHVSRVGTPPVTT